MTNSLPRSRAFHFLVALLSAAGFLVLVRVLPSLRSESVAEVTGKAAVEIVATIVLLYGLIRWGGQRRVALGLRPVRASTFGWGFLCFLASAILSAVTLLAFAHFGVTQDKSTLAALASKPVPVILLIAAMAAISEEIVFRSIVITQLEAATGMTWFAAIVSLAVFALAHAAGWGAWQIIFAAVPGLVLTIFFLWKRDLWICMIGHFLTDAVGLLSAAAAMAHHHP
jgi:membrane protease YdiL (CAAX protease family)